MCSLRHRFSSSNTPRDFKHSDRFYSVKGEEYRPFCSVYEKISTLFCLHLVTVCLK